MDELWYYAYSPSDYTRTYELLNSIEGKVRKNGKGNYSIEVFFDDSKINSQITNKGWNSHAGFTGDEFTKGLISGIIHGMGGSTTNPRYGEATNVIEIVQSEAEKYANKLLWKYFH